MTSAIHGKKRKLDNILGWMGRDLDGSVQYTLPREKN